MKQKVEVMEAIFGCETKNKYKLKNSMGQEVYTAKEDTDCCTRNLCGPIRPFGMVIKDNNDQVGWLCSVSIQLFRWFHCHYSLEN